MGTALKRENEELRKRSIELENLARKNPEYEIIITKMSEEIEKLNIRQT
jgi:hypothetical protein